jgi:ABC-type sugar transport system substrate-binding protein
VRKEYMRKGKEHMKRLVSIQVLLWSMMLIVFVIGLPGCKGRQEGPAKKRVAGIVFQEDQFFRLVLFGMRDAAARKGVELLEANSAGKPDKEIQLVNTYIAGNIDAIVISPLSAKASISALERAKEKGITVVTYNTTVEGDLPVQYVESDQYNLGATTGREARVYIEQKLAGKATVAILAFLSQAPEQSISRTKGFKDQISDMPGVRVVAEQDAWLAEQAVKKVGDILTANPSLNVVWAANEGGTVGAVMAVKNAGKAGKIVVFGTDASEQLANFLEDRDAILQAVTGQQPFEIGSLAVEGAVDVLNGIHVEKKVSLPGLLLNRDDPATVAKFKERLAQLNR